MIILDRRSLASSGFTITWAFSQVQSLRTTQRGDMCAGVHSGSSHSGLWRFPSVAECNPSVFIYSEWGPVGQHHFGSTSLRPFLFVLHTRSPERHFSRTSNSRVALLTQLYLCLHINLSNTCSCYFQWMIRTTVLCISSTSCLYSVICLPPPVQLNHQ